MKKRCLCVLLAGTMIMGGGVSTVCASETKTVKEEATIQPMYENVLDTSAILTLTDTGVRMKTMVETEDACSIRIMMKLKKKNGTTWKTVNTWFKYSDSASVLSLTKEYEVSSGTYKVESTITAGDEEVVVYSAQKTK